MFVQSPYIFKPLLAWPSQVKNRNWKPLFRYAEQVGSGGDNSHLLSLSAICDCLPIHFYMYPDFLQSQKLDSITN